MIQQHLQKVFESERKGHWHDAFWHYRELATRCPSQKVTAHFGFFCWYLLGHWDEISTAEEIFSPVEQFPIRFGGDFSRTELMMILNSTTGQMLGDAEHTPVSYLGALVQMQRQYPCLFERETFSDEIRDRLLRYLESRPGLSDGQRALFAVQHGQTLAPAQQELAGKLFPEGSLMRSYFGNL